MEEGARVGVSTDEGVVTKAGYKKLQERTWRHERLLGIKTEEVECLKESVRLGRERKLISRAPLFGIEGSNGGDRQSAWRLSRSPLRYA